MNLPKPSELKKIEEKVRAEWIWEKYKAINEMIVDLELRVKFCKTEDAKASQGSDTAEKLKEGYQKELDVRLLEKAFLEKQLS